MPFTDRRTATILLIAWLLMVNVLYLAQFRGRIPSIAQLFSR